jgi:hypothetical protein
MIINILSEKDFLDLLYGDWEFTDEAKKALYKHLNNAESNLEIVQCKRPDIRVVSLFTVWIVCS